MGEKWDGQRSDRFALGNQCVVEALLTGNGRMVTLVARRVWLVDALFDRSNILNSRQDAKRFQGQQSGTPAGGFSLSRGQHGPTKHVGHYLHPRGRMEQTTAAGNKVVCAISQIAETLRNEREAISHSFKAGLQYFQWSGAEPESGDHHPGIACPTRAALASQEWQHCEAMCIGWLMLKGLLDGFLLAELERLLQPG